MFNKLLDERGMKNIKVGIGMATDRELVVKTGRKNTGINNKVWIGKAVTVASNLSAHGDKDGYKRLMYSKCTYNNIIEGLQSKNPDKDVKSWFTYRSELKAYELGVVKSEFNNWIENEFGE